MSRASGSGVVVERRQVSIRARAIRSGGERRDELAATLENEPMTHYMLSVHSRDGEAGPAMTAEEIEESWSRISALEEDLKATGAWVFSARLHEAGTATVVRVANGEVLTTDGPFAESKDHLGGFYIIEAADLDAALGWAAKVTSAVGHPIEVRPFVDVAGG